MSTAFNEHIFLRGPDRHLPVVMIQTLLPDQGLRVLNAFVAPPAKKSNKINQN